MLKCILWDIQVQETPDLQGRRSQQTQRLSCYKGVNPLDKAFKADDTAYSKFSEHRKEVDQMLAEQASSRVKSHNASVTKAKKARTKLGGLKKLKKK